MENKRGSLHFILADIMLDIWIVLDRSDFLDTEVRD
jgi:hypothetical protein